MTSLRPTRSVSYTHLDVYKRQALGFVKCRETAEQFVSLHTEQDAVDRFDNQAFVVDIDHFDQGVTRGVVLLLLGGQAFFCFLPVCLRGRHGVVAVADRIGKEGLGVRAAILLVECGSVAECFKPCLLYTSRCV